MSLSACMRCWPATTRSPWFLYLLRPQYAANTDSCASLIWRNKGSVPSPPPSINAIQARVPTLPTPTTLRATSTSVKYSSRCLRLDCRVRRYFASTSPSNSWMAAASPPAASSSIGSIRGGSLMIRGWPSTTVVSLFSARMLS